MKAKFMRLNLLAVALYLLTLNGCGTSEKTPEADKLPVMISASKSINPNMSGKATPVSMTLYELRDSDNFNSSDFFTFMDASDPSLSNDISKVHEYILRPGESREFRLKLASDVNAIGVIAAFREVDKAEWRDLYQIKPQQSKPWYHISFSENEKKIKILVDKTSITIDEVK